jgi:membrane fusion protein (multidrug efflux system)
MKNRTETNSRLTLAGCLAALAIALSACSDEQASPPSRAQGPIDVGVVTLASEAVPFSMELPGRVLASSTAEIRPQVNGIVREKAFREGSEVAAGDVLYRLDDDTFQAAHEAAASALQGAEAGLAGAHPTPPARRRWTMRAWSCCRRRRGSLPPRRRWRRRGSISTTPSSPRPYRG